MVVAAVVMVVVVVSAGSSAGGGGDACDDEGVHLVHPEQDDSLPAAQSLSLSVSEGVSRSMLADERVSQLSSSESTIVSVVAGACSFAGGVSTLIDL